MNTGLAKERSLGPFKEFCHKSDMRKESSQKGIVVKRVFKKIYEKTSLNVEECDQIERREKIAGAIAFQQVCVLGFSGKQRGWSCQENGWARRLSEWVQMKVEGQMWWKLSEVLWSAAIFSVNGEAKSSAQSEDDKVVQRFEDGGVGVKQLFRGAGELLDQRYTV